MSEIVRLSMTLEESLQKRLEELMARTQYSNRSEFIRDLIRGRLVEEEWKDNEEALGTITLLYNHAVRHLSHKLTNVQHHHHEAVLATTHVHLDEELCAEMIMVRGTARNIEALAEAIRQQKGVLHVSVGMSSTGKQLR